MEYISTRGSAPALDFEGATLAGLASDGGLYVPPNGRSSRADEIAAMRGLPYAELAARVMQPFVGGSLTPEATARAVPRRPMAASPTPRSRRWPSSTSSTGCSSCSTARRWRSRTWRCNCSACCSRNSSPRRDEQLTIVGATSGDTGSAAIDAVAGRERIDIFMLHPKGRVSDVQRRQMTTVQAPNVHNIAIDGSFDDAQAMVKRMFGDSRDDRRASASARSIRSTGRG